MPGTKNSGNRKGPRGKHPIQRPPLAKKTAQTIRTILACQGKEYTPEAVADLIAYWAEREWAILDAEFQRVADEAWEGGVL